jgi:DNA-binding response OmpR family regulator
MVETRKRILCIDDDRETAALIAEDLADRGFDVSLAHDGQEGFTAILSGRPDLVVCDVNMPILSGLQMAERLALAVPDLNIPFVFLTAMSRREVGAEALKCGTYVTKPIDFDVLGAIIETRLTGLPVGISARRTSVNGCEMEGTA